MFVVDLFGTFKFRICLGTFAVIQVFGVREWVDNIRSWRDGMENARTLAISRNAHGSFRAKAR